MTYVVVTTLEQASWDQYQQVSRHAMAEGHPAGLQVHTAAPVEGVVQIVDLWDSEEEYLRFRDGALMGAVRDVMGEQAMQSPPPGWRFEAKDLVTR